MTTVFSQVVATEAWRVEAAGRAGPSPPVPPPGGRGRGAALTFDHALEVLAVPYGYSTRVSHRPWETVLDAYVAPWFDVVDRPTLEALMAPAMVTHAVKRSFTWLGAVEGAQPAELDEWGDSSLYYLRLALQPFPPEDPNRGRDGQ